MGRALRLDDDDGLATEFEGGAFPARNRAGSLWSKVFHFEWPPELTHNSAVHFCVYGTDVWLRGVPNIDERQYTT